MLALLFLLAVQREGFTDGCLGIYPTDGQVQRGELTDVAVCSKLHPLPALPLAEDGRQCSLCQGITSFLGINKYSFDVYIKYS